VLTGADLREEYINASSHMPIVLSNRIRPPPRLDAVLEAVQLAAAVPQLDTRLSRMHSIHFANR
jgi:hypothetical protein